MISKDFLEWTKDNGISYPKLQAALVDEGWRGLVCTGNLQAGELLVEVPQACLMSCHSARACTELGPLLLLGNSQRPMLQDIEILALHLLCEVSKGQASFWGPYIQQLPPRFDGYTTLSYFTAQHTLELQCGAAQAVVGNVKHELQASWRRCKAYIEALGLRGGCSGLEAFRWAAATISSRTMHVPWSSAGAFVPYADFFNYRPPPPPATPQLQLGDVASQEGPGVCGDGHFDPSTGTYKLFTHLSYSKGQQVFLCYGAHTNLELLEHYGFLLEDNPHDNALLPLHLFSSEHPTPSAYGKRHASQEPVLKPPEDISLPQKECYIAHSGVPSWELMKALRLACLGSKQRKSCSYLAASGQPCSKDSEIQVMRIIKDACTRHLASKSTTVQQDVEMLRAVQREDEILALAIHWRLCQKRILQRAVATFDKVLEGLMA